MTGLSNFIIAFSFVAVSAALMTEGAELLLRVAAQNSAMSTRSLFMMISYQKFAFLGRKSPTKLIT